MKALDSWARQFGYSDFDTYIQAGGSLAEVRRDIAKRIRNLQVALDALDFTAAEAAINMPPDAEDLMAVHTHTARKDEPDEPPDPDNAHVQGADG